MDIFLDKLASMATAVGGKIIFALLVLIIGRIIIKSSMKMLTKSRLTKKLEGTVRTFTLSFIKIGLYVILVISIIGIMGIPMASVVTVLASASVAIGLAVQGALSNLAGGIMLMIFKPFHVGDFVSAAGVEGEIREVTLFYTVFMTLDNRRITVPNGSLMNANVTNFSSEELRRVDLTFSCARSESPSKIQSVMLSEITSDPRVLPSPDPFARIIGGSKDSMEFAVRIWCKNTDYWDVYYDLTQKITEALSENNIQAPAVRICTDTKA